MADTSNTVFKERDSFERVLSFLDCAKRLLGNTSKAETSLDSKLAYQQEAQKFQDARHILRINYFAFKDWCENGIYIPPERKSFTVCKECGQITKY